MNLFDQAPHLVLGPRIRGLLAQEGLTGILAYQEPQRETDNSNILTVPAEAVGNSQELITLWNNHVQSHGIPAILKTPEGQWIIETQESQHSHNRNQVVQNRIALITGGAQGFGEEITRGLFSQGARVVIADLNAEGAVKLAQELNNSDPIIDGASPRAIGLEVNVADDESMMNLLRTVVETWGGLDLFVANAGVLKAASVLVQEVKDFEFVTRVNYTGYMISTKHAAPVMAQQSLVNRDYFTDIIQINSKSGLEGSNKNAAYAGSKFGGIGLTQSFALELVEYNIKVNSVCPGNFFDGPLWSHRENGLFAQYLRTGKVPGAKTIGDVKAFYEAKVPMKRGCTGLDVLRGILYLVEQKYETGQALPITGGQVMLN